MTNAILSEMLAALDKLPKNPTYVVRISGNHPLWPAAQRLREYPRNQNRRLTLDEVIAEHENPAPVTEDDD